MQSSQMRWCPNCETERELNEPFCYGCLASGREPWPIGDEPIRPRGWRPDIPSGQPPPEPTPSVCPNGHAITVGDWMCPTCNADILTGNAGPPQRGFGEPETPPFGLPPRSPEPVPQSEGTHKTQTDEQPAYQPEPEPPLSPETIDGWRLDQRLGRPCDIPERFVATDINHGRTGVLTLYPANGDPDPAVYALLRKLPRDHVPELIATGRHHDRPYDICEPVEGGFLSDLPRSGSDLQSIHRLAAEIGAALYSFGEAGLRHRDLKPGNIYVRTGEPLDLVITGFAAARLSESDLDIAAPLEMTLYTAPEAALGAVTAASDWWSLGMILLEQATYGHCFDGVNPRAFLMHAFASGIAIPEDLPAEIQVLLRGLLARDRAKRWSWLQLRAWLDGEVVEAPEETNAGSGPAGGPALALGGKPYTSPKRFALEAADGAQWDEARDMLLRGEIATWAAEAGMPTQAVSALRQIARRDGIHDDFRLSIALKLLNENMPLTHRGDIVNPTWLLHHSEPGYELITGAVPEILANMGSEGWLTRLKTRATAVREKARLLEIALDEASLRAYLLATSRSRLASEWEARRRLFPDTEHAGLASLMERRQSTEEDLIILLSADQGLLRPRDEVIEEAEKLCQRADIPNFNHQEAAAHLELSRRDLLAELRRRTGDLARCGIARADEWVEQLRLERRLPIGRALALLAVPEDQWLEPAKHEYYQRLLDYFEKKVTVSLARGPLVRMTIGKTTARVDACELGSTRRSTDDLITHILRRSDQKFDIDPAVFADSESTQERRLRHLVQNTALYKRDTGIDGLYLGFPFMLARDNRPTVKPRIAPILLWPVRIEAAVGVRGKVTIAFDRDREDVRLNPAFEAIVGADEIVRWKEHIDELLGRTSLSVEDVMDGFSTMASCTKRQVTRLPGGDIQLPPNTRQAVPCGVFFHLSYIGQAIVDDLRRMKARAPDDTAMAALLRIANAPAEHPTSPPPRETDRFFSAASDPSQDTAVFAARHAPGLLLEGPPGTGKSQTIVNTIADAIGRGKSALVVCQKQAAIEVVRKRLEKEGLQDRCVMVTDINKDRHTILQSIRDQVSGLRASAHMGDGDLRHRREQLAHMIEEIEGQLDRRHEAVHHVDAETGFSYRMLLAELIGLEGSAPRLIDVPRLRPLLETLPATRRVGIEEACASLVRYWLPAKFEHNPLHALKTFATDRGTLKAFFTDFEAFVAIEKRRGDVLAQGPASFEITDPIQTQSWLVQMKAQSGELRTNLALWVSLFDTASRGSASEGEHLIAQLDTLLDALGRALSSSPPIALQNLLLESDEVKFSALQRASRRVTTPRSFADAINPFHHLALRHLRGFLQSSAAATTHDLQQLHAAIHLEAERRGARQRLAPILKLLGMAIADLDHMAATEVGRFAAGVRQALQDVAAARRTLESGPEPVIALRAAKAKALPAFLEDVAAAIIRCEARLDSMAALDTLANWFGDAWIAQCRSGIAEGQSNAGAMGHIADALPTLEAFQQFRRRAGGLDEAALAVFERLREVAPQLTALPQDQLAPMIRRIIAREIRLAIKSQFEAREPALLMEQDELRAKIETLGQADRDIRVLNGRMLADGIDISRVQLTQQSWQKITRLRAARGVPRSSIRDLIENGRDLGLFELRPVWLVNPDVASRILPLTPGLFDVVIYDEASQMPVEYALPTLFRAAVTVVSGDEKQMPPTAFFASHIEDDEDDVPDIDDLESLSESAREALDETWNRREIKDCPDLLNLARVCLPVTTLEVHYRSAYRELIAFSNAAFYGNRLNVPVQHPDATVRREKPIELIHVNGVYAKRTNSDEADRVVALLADYWTRPQSERPSIGVVTFNRNQADLIEERLEARAEADEDFRRAYVEERQRRQDHEDIGFFVKNVENVQGDERDLIIFSTTFGRDGRGVFRRNFGVLGQQGGRRRLNVAVTRAKQKVIVATSIPVGDVSDMLSTHRPPVTERDYLQGYLEFSRALSVQDLDAARALCQRMVTEGARLDRRRQDYIDGFRYSVERFIRDLGYEPVMSDGGDAFAVDIAIMDPTTGLYSIGIECDAPRHDILAHARARELWRPGVLAGTMRRLHRVSCVEWYERRSHEEKRLRVAIVAALSNQAGRAA